MSQSITLTQAELDALPNRKQKNSNEWSSACPICDEGDDRFIHTVDTGLLWCRICGAGGRVIAKNGDAPIAIAEDTKRAYGGLEDYARAHGVDAATFEAAGWSEVKHAGRQALRIETEGAPKYRFLDNATPRYQRKGAAVWYRLSQAVTMANDTGQPLVFCNGEASTVVGQSFGIAACTTTGGEGSKFSKKHAGRLLADLKNAYSGQIIIALDSDTAGRKGAAKLLSFFTENNLRAAVVDFNGGKGFDLADYCKLHTVDALDALKRLQRPPKPETEPETETPAALVAADDRWLPQDTIIKSFKTAEHGDATLMAALYADRIAYDHTEKTWYLWNGQHWQCDDTRQVKNFVAQNLAAQYLHAAAETQKHADDDQSRAMVKALWKRAASLRFKGKINNVLDLCQSQPALALTGREWEKDAMTLAVQNGVIDLETGKFRRGQPSDYIRTAAPVEWQGIDAPAPRWEQFIDEILGYDVAVAAFVQRLLGYGITGQTTEHILPILWGKGRNGKDTLLECLAAVLGDLAAPASRDVLLDSGRNPGSATPHLYALRPLRLSWVSESRAGARLNVEQVKRLTGGGTITARPLHGNQIKFKPSFLLMMMTNHKPKADADDYALWKRIALIPFTRSFVDNPTADGEQTADPKILEKLTAEASGILAWLIRGCLAWGEEGLNPPLAVQSATDEYQKEEDELSQFVAECCVVTPEAEIKGKELYTAYQQWAIDYGQKPASNTIFGTRMRKRFNKRMSGGVTYDGIRLSKPNIKR